VYSRRQASNAQAGNQKNSRLSACYAQAGTEAQRAQRKNVKLIKNIKNSTLSLVTFVKDFKDINDFKVLRKREDAPVLSFYKF